MYLILELVGIHVSLILVVGNNMAAKNGVTDPATTGGEDIHMRHLASTLLSFQRLNLFCDTAIVAHDGTLFAHSAVLAAVCPSLFTSLNQHPFVSAQKNIVDLSQYDSELIGHLVEFFYTGKICMTRLVELQVVCERLGIVVQMADAIAQSSKSNTVITAASTAVTNGKTNSVSVALDQSVAKNTDRITTVKSEADDLQSTSIVILSVESQAVRLSIKDDGHPITDRGESFTGNLETTGGDTGKKMISIDNEAVLDSSDAGTTSTRRRDGGYACGMCDKVFYVRRRLSIHLNEHICNEAGMFRCRRCPKSFGSRWSALCHEKTHVRAHQCQTCGRRFASAGRLHSHENKHTGQRPYVCSTCGHTFTDNEYLAKHVLNHTTVRQRVPCGICGASLCSAETLAVHMRQHTGERPAVCDICGKSFTQSASLRTHLMRHRGVTPYSCPGCERSFLSKYRLNMHIELAHTADTEKNFWCPHCSKGFTRDRLLMGHLRSHETRKLYKRKYRARQKQMKMELKEGAS